MLRFFIGIYQENKVKITIKKSLKGLKKIG